MSPAPPGPWERRAHPAARGRRARPSLAPGRRPQPRSAFTARPASAERGTTCPALPGPHAAVTRPGERLLDTEPGPEDAGSPQRLSAAATPGQEPTRPAPEAVACASAPAVGAGEGRACSVSRVGGSRSRSRCPDDRQIPPAWGRAFASVCFG